MQNFVFCLPLVDIQNIDLGQGTYTNLETNAVAIVPYEAIREYVLVGQIQLV